MSNQAQFAAVEVPSSARRARPHHVEDSTESMGSLESKLSSGRAFLKVIAYPWGVEFDVCEAEGER